MKKLLMILWFYILSTLQKSIDRNIKLSNKPYVVWFSSLYPEVYVCEDGAHALSLVETYKQLNEKLNRHYITIQYGSIDVVYLSKLPRLMDLIFTWNATQDEKELVYKKIIDTPTKI